MFELCKQDANAELVQFAYINKSSQIAAKRANTLIVEFAR